MRGWEETAGGGRRPESFSPTATDELVVEWVWPALAGREELMEVRRARPGAAVGRAGRTLPEGSLTEVGMEGPRLTGRTVGRPDRERAGPAVVRDGTTVEGEGPAVEAHRVDGGRSP